MSEDLKLVDRRETVHAQNVRYFMRLGNQRTPEHPQLPTSQERELRAALHFEETMESINDLGVQIGIVVGNDVVPLNDPINNTVREHDYSAYDERCCNLVGIVDGCIDMSVVAIGTVIACGACDVGLLEAVDANNLAKFGPGHTIREDGKVVKPADHTPPDLHQVLVNQGMTLVQDLTLKDAHRNRSDARSYPGVAYSGSSKTNQEDATEKD